ncbi:MAG: DUF2235 domain-containing protein [Gammaproteobacteria bacterium]|nr:DUF2235 domain-containing protein [Gammaproteobacteria bacterium]
MPAASASCSRAGGWSPSNILYEAYRFVCVNHRPGDEIFLFGFSRGAYIARSLAGMIGRAGLVPRSRLADVPRALEVYRSGDGTRQKEFRDEVGASVPRIDFLGVWDTVGALGIPDLSSVIGLDRITREKYRFHDLTLGTHVRRAAHAVAIDERRKLFAPTLMEQDPDAPKSQRLVQSWFPGDHGCVGGGTWEKRGLSNRCLQWMVEQASHGGRVLGADLELLHDHAVADHGIYFEPSTQALLPEGPREIPDGVQWKDIDRSARLRYRETNGADVSTQLKNRFREQLDALPASGTRRMPKNARHLGVGQSAEARVEARRKHNPTRVRMKAGERYEIRVPPVQVWKDGGWDPCDVRGWNTIDSGPESKLPWEDGERASGGWLDKVIRKARDHRLVPEADWFELVARIGEGPWFRLDPPEPDSAHADLVMGFTADADGELMLAANDLASRWDLIDKYDNNQGWIWARIRREA